MRTAIPKEVRKVADALTGAGFEAYLVGGCVRDLLLGREPKDWDIATNAAPERVQKLFDDSVYENQFGTVGVKTESEDPTLKIIEVTTYRIEGRYTDKRHPDTVKFAQTIEEDLSRRDFTVNALALDPVAYSLEPETGESHFTLPSFGKPSAGKHASRSGIVDPYGGQQDLKKKVLRTVGSPRDRFNEDALRLMRAVRFSVELDFELDLDTRRAIEKEAGLLEAIAKERIKDEFIKMLMADRAAAGILLLEELDLLRYVLPELREGLGVGQNQHHIYTIFEHSVKSLDYSAKHHHSLVVRLAALFHDVGKARTKAGEGVTSTFYNHERIGAKMTVAALDRLCFPRETTEEVAHLIRYHMFYYNVGEVTEAGVRRFLNRVGPEYLDDLIKVREADRIGSGVPKAVPYKLRHLLFMIEKVKSDPISPKMLAAKGDDVMRILGIPPGPRVGYILAILLEEVLDDPKVNMPERLESRIKELGALSDAELEKLSKRARSRKEEFEEEVEEGMKKKYYVQ
jgi:tRNA nucleotidyltransferase (CCA-adding enzyme)